MSQISNAQLSPTDHWDPRDVKPVIVGKNTPSSLQTVSFLQNINKKRDGKNGFHIFLIY